jgi:hypothetical protein
VREREREERWRDGGGREVKGDGGRENIRMGGCRASCSWGKLLGDELVQDVPNSRKEFRLNSK